MLRIRKTKKAASLAEVMIVLGVVSTAMVASISVMVNSLVRIRVNDIEDSSNTVLIQALEIAKSPTGLIISTDISQRPVNNSIYLSLENNDRLSVRAGSGPLISCSETSIYNVNDLLPDDVSASSQVCVQIEIIPRTGINGRRIYEIIARSSYIIPGGDVRANVIKGYRYSDV